MNAYKLNSLGGHILRKAICEELNISPSEVYKETEDIKSDGHIITKNGDEYLLKLIKLK